MLHTWITAFSQCCVLIHRFQKENVVNANFSSKACANFKYLMLWCPALFLLLFFCFEVQPFDRAHFSSSFWSIHSRELFLMSSNCRRFSSWTECHLHYNLEMITFLNIPYKMQTELYCDMICHWKKSHSFFPSFVDIAMMVVFNIITFFPYLIG